MNLDEPAARDRAVAGGKAATLAELAAAGFPVPAGMVLPAGTVNTAPAGTVNTGPTGTVNTSPTGTANTSPTGTANTTPTGTANTSPTGTANTGPTGTANTSPTGTVNTGPTGAVETPAAGAAETPRWRAELAAWAAATGADRFAVRSSAVAEDLADASYAGLYETFLDVPADGLSAAVPACVAAAGAERVTGYRERRPGDGDPAVAVLIQPMVDAVAAGVAFTAHPVTGDRGRTVVTAVRGLGDPLASGRAEGEEWTIEHPGNAEEETPRPGDAVGVRRADGFARGGEPAAGTVTLTRRRPGGPVLTRARAAEVAALAGRVARRYDGRPQDVEWAFDGRGALWLLQARPMTALPPPVAWDPPGPGRWMRNFRLGEWLPEAVTPLFATWLLPAVEDGYLDGMRDTVGVAVPFRYALINGWYYNAPPIPSPALAARLFRHGGLRAVRILYHALVGVGRDPVAADRAVLGRLAREWRDEGLPRYRHAVAAARAEVATAGPDRLAEIVDALARAAGVALWQLAVVGGSAWKMEDCLTRFVRRHLPGVLPDADGGVQVLLRGLPGVPPPDRAHAVHSADWYHPVAAELPPPPADPAAAARHDRLAACRVDAERRCTAALAGRPRRGARFAGLLRVTQRYAVLREQQAADLTLAWPVLRECAARLGGRLHDCGLLDNPGDVHFCTRADLAGPTAGLPSVVDERRRAWCRQRRLAAPLALGDPPRLVGDVIDRAVRRARGPASPGAADLIGHPASAGRATGPVHLVSGPRDFAAFPSGAVLVARATAPAWTPLFARAAAVVTDGGSLAAHASLIAREYGIPAVVGTGDATARLRPGQRVTVDGSAGTVTIRA